MKAVVKKACRILFRFSVTVLARSTCAMVLFSMQRNDNCWYSSISEATMCNICVLHEMIEIRTGTKICDNFSLEEVQVIIEDICLK